MKRWAMRIGIGLVVTFIVVYCGDWAVFKLRVGDRESLSDRSAERKQGGV
jgi:hypothetical protein